MKSTRASTRTKNVSRQERISSEIFSRFRVSREFVSFHLSLSLSRARDFTRERAKKKRLHNSNSTNFQSTCERNTARRRRLKKDAFIGKQNKRFADTETSERERVKKAGARTFLQKVVFTFVRKLTNLGKLNKGNFTFFSDLAFGPSILAFFFLNHKYN